MIWLKDDAVLILENEIIQHVKRYPGAHHHTLDEMVHCCLTTAPQFYWLFISEPVLSAHFSHVRNKRGTCKIKFCFCLIPKENLAPASY